MKQIWLTLAGQRCAAAGHLGGIIWLNGWMVEWLELVPEMLHVPKIQYGWIVEWA